MVHNQDILGKGDIVPHNVTYYREKKVVISPYFELTNFLQKGFCYAGNGYLAIFMVGKELGASKYIITET